MNYIRRNLVAARALIAKSENWTVGFFAKDEHYVPVGADDPSACRFCAVGALQRTAWHSDLQMECEFLRNAAAKLTNSHESVTNYNDTKTHAEVLQMFDTAIEMVGAL